MYLQSLEIIGFKSFARKTRLVFEPGITAIVGPNGCGKSNLSDAIRWVLGEQRPTSLRSSVMTDVIFNGTEQHKPLSMTEVSITFADCEKELGTEYNEVTISRRVFRSGEGQYFINKTPCRLRDIQRLFMGTGIGTTSYSIMAQGQIDAVLSSRPEDRRAIFEEAAGITRFRADRREAMRKLDQTEANLLRLNDVIRELHRQIGSLQRQAGKARRYKTLQGELRKLDLFVTSEKVKSIHKTIKSQVAEIEHSKQELERLRVQVEEGEKSSTEARARLMDSERRIGVAMEQAMEAQGKCNQASDAVRNNKQRIEEYNAWTGRDEAEISETKSVRIAQEEILQQIESQLIAFENEFAKADSVLSSIRNEFDAKQADSTKARNELHRLREESIKTERLHISLQNELTKTEGRTRENLLRNERLSSEKSGFEVLVRDLETRLSEVEAEVASLDSAVSKSQESFIALEKETEQLRSSLNKSVQKSSEIQSRIAAHKAKIQILDDSLKQSKKQSGASLVTDVSNPLKLSDNAVLGHIAKQFKAPKSHRVALEAVLRAWLDTIAVRTRADAQAAVKALQAMGKKVGVSLFAADGNEGVSENSNLGFPRLIDAIECKADFRETAENLLGNVYIVDSLDVIPSPFPSGCAFVTLSGIAEFHNGMVELRSREEAAESPLSRYMMVEDARAELAAAEADLAAEKSIAENLGQEIDKFSLAARNAREQLDKNRKLMAQKEGERNTISSDFERAKRNLLNTTSQLENLLQSTEATTNQSKDLMSRIDGMGDSRKRLSDAVEAAEKSVRDAEARFLEAQAALTEARISQTSISHRVETARTQKETIKTRIDELERMIKTRDAGIKSYGEGIIRLKSENEKLEKNLVELEAEVLRHKTAVDKLRAEREQNSGAVEDSEKTLHVHRKMLDEAGDKYNRIELSHVETKMRLQNIQDRLMTDWHISIEQLASEPVPDWGSDGEPELGAAEERISEIRARMESMGPVNLVAIEEYQEIEERHAFLTAQEEDLTNGRAKLLELIKDIDRQSSELFNETFEKAKTNFQTMFERLFNGGTAELKLLDDDLLESGIDIIARPPGKKQQSIALLSGGERALTAISLLFAIYMIRPSPFAMLDEIDASLDDSNIGRFVGVLNDFLDQSQFIIITHNQHTIAGADIVYGVTQEEHGISKIISMRLKRMGIDEPAEEEFPEINSPPPPSKRKMKNHESV
ncbi:MAG: chromosome segregation protein SMC [Lentisphaerae bacterium]|nr:chromosome segregation protein SMC [Lentisphaerota bacterium]